MNLKNSMRKTILQIAGKTGVCLDEEHCPTRTSATPPAAVAAPYVPTFAPPTGGVGPANVEGALQTLLRSDCVLAHGDLSGLVTPAHAHPDLSGVTFAQHHGHYARYNNCVFDLHHLGFGWSTGYIGFVPMQVPFTMTLDRIGYVCGAAPSGNARCAIYHDNGDMPDGGALIVETASVAMVARKNELTIADTQLTPGLYWLAYQGDDVPTIFGPHTSQCPGGTLFCRSADGGIGYGAFPDPAPATVDDTEVAWQFVRVKSVP